MKKPIILGISAFYHDSAAAIIRGTEIIAAAQEERFTRKKFDKSFPKHAIEYCLKEAKIDLKNLDAIAFYEDPILKWDRVFSTTIANKKIKHTEIKKLQRWIENKLFIEDAIYHHFLKDFQGTILFSQHHLSHACSAFFPSPFEEATIVVIDGIGEWACTSIGVGKGEKVELLQEQRFPNSVGFLYSAFTQYLGFKVDSGEYKVMGLAPYGKPKYVEKIKNELIDVGDNGTLELELKYFDFISGNQMINKNFDFLFGAPKRKETEILEQFHFDIAASIQAVVEEIIEKIVVYAVKITGNRKLVMAGGVSLNCVSNGKLLNKKIVDELWVQPCAGDGGGALGAALLASYSHFHEERIINKNDSQKGSYLGPSYSREEIENILKSFGFVYQNFETKEKLFDETANKLNEGKVIGVFQGRMEYGPRALGSRSIIADPRNSRMQENLNQKIKFRESFRPFAPIVLEERSLEWFEKLEKSPYMLFTTQVEKEKLISLSIEEQKKTGLEMLQVVRSKIPAVTHVNQSARIQTVTQDRNYYVYSLLKAFEKKTGCPILINTSFNIRGEPIVCTPFDALQCFMNTNMDFIVLENFLIDKKRQQKQLVQKEFLEYLNYG